MGFDLARFIGEVDEEFQCSICSMVLENPVQSQCNHLFCSECINDWLAIKELCPVDRKPLANTDLKPIYRTVRNLLDKLEVKCDFDSQGCNVAVKLECLQDHLASCDYNPDALIVCDKGCNLQMSRREYQTRNCFAHLAVNHKKEIAALVQELGNQKEHSARQGEEIGRLSNEVIQLRREKDRLIDLERVTNRQEEEIKKLSDEVHQLRRQQNPFEAPMQQGQEISNLIERTEISLKAPMKWEWSKNIKSPTDQPDVLELGDKSGAGFVRSFHALEPKNSVFKVQVLNGECFAVGLLFKGNAEFPGWFAKYHGEDGSLCINGLKEYEGPKCNIGDIIELGIRFPLNFVNDGNASVELYLSINERVVNEKLVKMPTYAVYPTIGINDRETKIKYFGI